MFVFRLFYLVFILSRHGVLGHLAKGRWLPRWLGAVLRIAHRIIAAKDHDTRPGLNFARALERMGPAFIKLGQALSTRADLLGGDFAADLARLQDRLAPFPGRQARAIIADALRDTTGQDFDAVFKSFDDEPVAAASIAQVHFAHLTDGSEVAVKILRPGIAKKMERDIAFFRQCARLTETLAPALRQLKLVHAVDQFARISETELDLRIEAAAAGKLRENHANDEGIYVPKIRWELSSEKMLMMERIDGIRIDDRAALTEAGHDIEAITRIAAKCFFVQVFRDGFFHADMHPGNIFIRADGALVPIDFGIMGSLSLPDRMFLARLLNAMLARDYDAVARLHIDAGMLREEVSVADFSLALRAAMEPIMDKPMGEISLGTVLGHVFGLARRFSVEIQPQFTLLQKTMVMAEGVGRQLNPDANMWPIARELANDWLGRKEADIFGHLGDFGEKIRDLAPRIPEIFEKLATALDRAAAPPLSSKKPRKTAGFLVLAGIIGGIIGAGGVFLAIFIY